MNDKNFQKAFLYGKKRFAVLANRIVDIEDTNFFCYTSKILVVSTAFFSNQQEFVGRTLTNQEITKPTNSFVG